MEISCLRQAANAQLALASSRSSLHQTSALQAARPAVRGLPSLVPRLRAAGAGCSNDGGCGADAAGLRFKFAGGRIARIGEPPLLRRRAPAAPRAGSDVGSTVDASGSHGVLHTAKELLHLALSLGSFLALDKYLKNVFLENAIRFPSALFGMLSLFVLLSTLSAINTDAADKVESFFSPAILFIQRWLPLFYVPSLVVVPLAVKGIPAAEGAKIGAILVGGWMGTLLVAGYTAVQVRKMVNTELLPAEPVAKAAPFTNTEIFSWTAIMLLSFGMAVRYPTALGPETTTTAPFLLAATVVGYLVGTSLPAAVKKVFHPIITCALTADLGAYALGMATGKGFEATLGGYLTKNSGSPGAGDMLMGFLGSVILSFAFSMYRQRKVIQRHAAEIITAVVVSSLFSLYSTAGLGRLLGILPSLTCAIIPRCVTVALALPIASLLEGNNPSLTAAAVVVTGLIGANFAQVVMDKFGLKDPIARGMATAASAHGLGTAALAGKEPEALPYCAIAYAITGIVSTLLCTLPPVRTSLLMLAGAA
ncbi:hypothetical protein M758_9G019100 [Ceratodon purpureus]|uniref:Plastidal glycolate/glycerate translocator 1, chloroplastic n=1 Tax=Ceratodon purpureus TaxID=3225 RepID=A0A8T0GPL1_CERPU|nr:hypothetical protein KC19_9G019100 [Ceratodon purpureus]KAG0604915.1 hypothetical protein M758_9G019100 [Ceratodon purpureus]